MTPEQKKDIKELLKADFHERLRRAQEQLHYEYLAFPEAREEMTRKVMEQDIKVEFVPMSEEGRKAMDELSAKWKERALQIELAEYEKLDQYFKEHGVK
jgi:hypothetical protein